MTSAEFILLGLAVAAWLLLVIVRAVTPANNGLSAYELDRRVEKGDQEAQYERWRNEMLINIGGLKNLLSVLLLVAVILLTASVVGPALGWLAALVVVLASEWVGSQRFTSRKASSLFERYEASLLKWIEKYPWLKKFAATTLTSEYRIGSKEELAERIAQLPNDILSSDDRDMLQSQLEFGSKMVCDVMTPKTMIDTVNVTDAIGPLVLDDLHKTGHSRFPVIDGDIDHVVGVLYLRQLIGLKSAHDTVKQAMDAQVFYIGENQSLEHALHGFLRTHHHLFIVVNDYRETVGLLTLEDVIEALIGRSIVDEFDEFSDLRLVASNNPKSNNSPKRKKDI